MAELLISWPQYDTREVHRLQDELGLPHFQTVNGHQSVDADERLLSRIRDYAARGFLRIKSIKKISV